MQKQIIPRSSILVEFFRNNWMSLNGEWEFEIDKSDSGLERKFYNREKLESIINVPFVLKHIIRHRSY